MLLTTMLGLAKRTHQFVDWLGYAKDNATTLLGEVGDKVGPGAGQVRSRPSTSPTTSPTRSSPRAQRLSREVSKLAAEASDQLGPEVEKYARAGQLLRVAELDRTHKARPYVEAAAQKPNPKDSDA